MRKLLLYLTSFLLLGFTTFAQSKSDVVTPNADSAQKDSLLVKPMLSKEIITVKSTGVSLKRDTLVLKKQKPLAGNNLQGKFVYEEEPVDPTDPGTPVDPTDPGTPIDPGGSTNNNALDPGRTVGSLNVSPTGGAGYSVPISLPPGLGDNVPRLALVYNSHAGKGTAGLGWTISGLSAITRISTSLFHDGRIDGINIDNGDRFALDGQRLILKSGTYGADGAEYQTENFSNVRVISRGNSSTSNGTGPAYFEVLYPDGSKAFYGVDANSRNQVQWAINFLENPLNARISYTYQLINNSITISQVSFGGIGSPNGSPVNAVDFFYDYANRQEQAYVGGIAMQQERILTKISVTGSGNYFRHYKLTYGNVPTLNHQRLASIQEFNGSEQGSFSPIYFSYGSTSDIVVSNSINNLSISGIASNNSEVLTADFTGNGSMDFLVYPKGYRDKFWAFYDVEANSPYYQMGYQVNTGTFLEIFPVTSLSYNNKVLPGQGMALVKDNGTGSYKFDVYSSGTVSPVYYQYSRVWDNVPQGPSFYSGCDNQDKNYPLNYQFLSGDFNGDGLTDIAAVNDAIVVTYENAQATDDPYYNPGNCDQGVSDVGSTVHFINLDRQLSSNFVINTGMLSASWTAGEKLMTGDFNGDGKTDILQIKNGRMLIYSLDHTNSLQMIWSSSDNRISLTQQILLGDYNGDGKLDVMFSTGNNSLFATFISTGKSFIKFEQYQPFSNTAGTWNGTPPGTLDLYYLVANDIDGDGKTDIVSSRTVTTNNSDYGSTYVTVYYSGNSSYNGQPSFFYGASTSKYGVLKHYPIPIFLNPSKPNVKLEFGFMSHNSVSLFRFNRDFKTESQLTAVNQDGITHTIEYKSIDSDQSYGSDIQLYSSGFDQNYPYVDLHTIPGLNVVTKVNRYHGSETISQVFGYGKAVSHAGGLGFLGFGEVVRSNWFAGSGDINRSFTTTISDPQLRGATVKSFVSRSPYISSTIKNMTMGNASPATPVADGATLSDYINRSDQAYSTELSPNKVFRNVAVASGVKDMLNSTYQVQNIEYDAYFNQTRISTNINGQGNKLVEVSYENNPTAGYIGRPLTSKTTINNGTDISTSDEEFSYTGFLPTQVRRKGNGTNWVTENITYDNFGNVTGSITSLANGQQRSVSKTYDPTGRFVTGTTGVDGLTSTASYDQSTGNKTSTTNSLGQTESYLYDNWGRLNTTTNYLNVKSYRSYQRDGYNIVITDSDDEGHSVITVTNPLGQVLETKEKNVLGQYVGKATQFDLYGRESAISEPGIAGSYTQWNTKLYDEYGRLKQSASFTGKVASIIYNGLSATVSDGVKSVTTTKNAFGKTTNVQDPGGSINYTYFANGGMKTADYGGIIQTVEQDGWGRRTKLTDPSAGVYQYEFDDWGQMVKETSPKGYTQYVFDLSGKISQKKVIGDEVNMQYSYTYDPTTKLLSEIGVANASGNNATYKYNYDGNHRLGGTIEDNLHARFVKTYTYDSYGRINVEAFEAKDKQSGITVQKAIERHYQNGEALQVTLQGTGNIVWKINNLDARGEVTEAIQGSALKNTYQYDAYGLPQQMKVQNVVSNPVTLMDLGYNFDAQRGNLSNRSNSAFNWSESFSYDNQDRLTGFNDNQGNNSQTYDNRGRILNNSQLGDYSYDGASYKQTELDLSNNPGENAYYQQAHALQQVTYNAFNSPVEIIEQGKERVSFEYNALLNRSHMYYGDEQPDKMNRRFRRHYSIEGGMEITDDLQTGKTSFVFYLAGDAYSAPAIWKEEHQNGQNTQNLYYFHRDHLGSIVMITNEQGNVVEKRQFDAWGNIVRLQDGNGNNLSAFLITDRGYTGHEHLLGVGLINMNGRLYDPRLHRFLSPDNFVQDPYNTQNYNRFGYALNNPLMYTDPNGEFIFAFLIPVVGKFVAALITGAVIGAGVGAVSYTTSVALSNGGFKNWDWGQFGKSVGFGAISGVATTGIGIGFGDVGKFGHEVLRGAAHGIAQGGISELSGGDFVTGFATGALGSLAGSGWEKWGLPNSGVGTIAFSAVSGGIGAELTGGDFWRGAATGAVIAGLNHLAHNAAEDEPKKEPTLQDLKENPPTDPGYKAPKSGARKVNHPRGKGWIDDKGNVWIPDDHNGTHAPHWDVQPKKGPGYRTVYPSVATVAKITTGVAVGIIIWEGLKWGVAILGAPETGGASLGLLAIP